MNDRLNYSVNGYIERLLLACIFYESGANFKSKVIRQFISCINWFNYENKSIACN